MPRTRHQALIYSNAEAYADFVHHRATDEVVIRKNAYDYVANEELKALMRGKGKFALAEADVLGKYVWHCENAEGVGYRILLLFEKQDNGKSKMILCTCLPEQVTFVQR